VWLLVMVWLADGPTRAQSDESDTSCLPPSENALLTWARDPDAPVPVILDTDFAADVDDVGALAILHGMADQGEANILGVMLSSGGEYAARAVDAVNTYYGRPDVPIGITWRAAAYPSSRYTFDLAFDFPNDILGVPDAVALYRQILAQQPDHSVTIVSVGFLTNLGHLLETEADANSDLNGFDLVRDKVARLVVMGGHYPDSASHPDGVEYNFELDAEAAQAVVRDWPTPMIFSGFEIGVDIETGAVLQTETPADNPVRRAYQRFNGGQDRSSWDLTAVYFAVRGTGDIWKLCNQGTNRVDADGRNHWDTSEASAQAYLSNQVPKETIRTLLNGLLIQPPQRME
ncbi:MAG: nucleoside hydrolase, partial [Anaerolineae bacterium]|nr:nucleoside hydrolase [Anaerolineae bacterium]